MARCTGGHRLGREASGYAIIVENPGFSIFGLSRVIGANAINVPRT